MRSVIFGIEERICPRSTIEALESRIAPATIFVTTLDDAGAGSLRSAIDQANDDGGADVIKFKVKGEILLESALPAITDSLTIKGKNSAKTVIDGNDAYRVLEIASPDPLNVTISGVTLQNSRAAESGGALEINNALGKVTITKSVIQDSFAVGAPGEDAVGGGIANHNALLTITKSTVSGNQAVAGNGQSGENGTDGSAGVVGTDGGAGAEGNTARGGGIFNGYYAALTVVKSTISDNTAKGGAGGTGGNGGAAGTGAGNIAGNGADGGRGGMAFGGGIDSDGSLSIQNSVISGNVAIGGFGGTGGNAGAGDAAAYAGYGGDGGDALGGGVSSAGGLDLFRSGVYDNEALGNYGGDAGTGEYAYEGYAGYGRGGGVGVDYGRALIARTTISGNYAEYGGGLYIASDEAYVEDSLILSNDALEGGGMYVEGGGTEVFNTVIEDNIAADGGGGIAAHGELDIIRSRITANFVDAFEGEPTAEGGGLLVTGNVRVVESVISFNEVNGSGGGIFVDEGSLELTRSDVSSNTAVIHGGGIVASEDANVFIDDSAVTDNSAGEDGGGLRLHDYASVVVERSIISFNLAGRDGGGISVEDSAELIVRETTVSGNTADRNGGGISNTGEDYYYDYYGGTIEAASTRIERSTISGNQAIDGGGVFHTGGYLDIIASTIARNAASGDGGGISMSASVYLLASTIAANSADGAGGGLWIDDAQVDPFDNWISSTIIADNAAPSGADVFGQIEANYTLVENTDDADVIGENNILEVDPRLGPLKNNGGYTQTMLPKANSVVIDSGAGLGEVFDQRGNLRLRGAGVDIGAVEAK